MWGPVNGEIAALGEPCSHLKRAQKKPWTQRQGQTGSFMLPSFPFLSFSPFPVLISFLSSPLLPHCFSLSLLFPLLPPPLPCPFSPVSSSQVELCETGLSFMPCTAQWVPCQALRVQGYSPGTGKLAWAQASVAHALVSWQSS